jgi:hypothetical protein
VLSKGDKSHCCFLTFIVEYGADWNIKFNHLKSCVFQTGNLFKNQDINLVLNSVSLTVVSDTKYLGLKFKNNMNFSDFICEKFKDVQKSYNSLFYYGTKPNGLNPATKAHIYTTFCLPKALYDMGVITVNDCMIKKLDRI